MDFIPQIEPWIDDAELRHVTEVVKSTFITENAKTEEFLEKVKSYTGAKYAIAMANGTLGLVAALLAESIGPGDEVIVPDLTFIATANAVRLVGARPVFCDVNYPDGCIDVAQCERLIGPATKAIMPVHLYGQFADVIKLGELCSRKGLLLIEDAAESFGMWTEGQHAGTFGEYGIFSCFANKTITCGEGGIVLTDSEERYKRLYRIKNHGRDRKGIFIHEHIGYNFCFSDLHAAIGVAQLDKLPEILKRKKQNYTFYEEALSSVDGVELVQVPKTIESNYWFNNVLVDDPPRVEACLKDKGIGTRRLFYPMHLQPCFKKTGDAKQPCPNSGEMYARGLSIPSGPNLTQEQLARVCDAIASTVS